IIMPKQHIVPITIPVILGDTHDPVKSGYNCISYVQSNVNSVMPAVPSHPNIGSHPGGANWECPIVIVQRIVQAQPYRIVELFSIHIRWMYTSRIPYGIILLQGYPNTINLQLSRDFDQANIAFINCGGVLTNYREFFF